MPGPKDAVEALKWVQDAVQAGRYIPSIHFYERLAERKIDIEDVFSAVDAASTCVVFEQGTPQNGGTCWRVIGKNIDGDQEVAVGVEAFLDHKRRRCILCTVFKPGE
jgi:hypothetical protein